MKPHSTLEEHSYGSSSLLHNVQDEHVTLMCLSCQWPMSVMAECNNQHHYVFWSLSRAAIYMFIQTFSVSNGLLRFRLMSMDVRLSYYACWFNMIYIIHGRVSRVSSDQCWNDEIPTRAVTSVYLEDKKSLGISTILKIPYQWTVYTAWEKTKRSWTSLMVPVTLVHTC